MRLSRKAFMKTLSVSVVSAPLLSSSFPESNKVDVAPVMGDKLGLASYSLRSFSLDDVIDTMKRLGLKHVALKSMHMPLDSSDEEIRQIAEKVRSSGLDLYGAGVIYMKTADEVANAFRYARAAGISTIIGVPNHELLPQVNDLVRETDIKVAIHNHGPGDELYPSPESILMKVKDLDKRVGVCLDIGHAVRIGLDPGQEAKRCGDRLYDMHFKDVNVAAPEGGSLEMGRGVIDLPAFLKTLSKIKYQGVMGLEYEKDGKDPFLGLAESVGYCRGLFSCQG
ncbi:MAG: sugar phosphate isomerase/epimerase [Saprospiraceae bacterium]|nr:sugar phosphate isomerase/epimerase [Saprospiraceae bacterium]